MKTKWMKVSLVVSLLLVLIVASGFAVYSIPNVYSATQHCTNNYPERSVLVGYWQTRVNPPGYPVAKEISLQCYASNNGWFNGDEYLPYGDLSFLSQ
jgi:hypothetical protein